MKEFNTIIKKYSTFRNLELCNFSNIITYILGL